MSVAQLPGSMYPTEIRNPGPRKPSSLRQPMDEREMPTLECTSGREGSGSVTDDRNCVDMVSWERDRVHPSTQVCHN